MRLLATDPIFHHKCLSLQSHFLLQMARRPDGVLFFPILSTVFSCLWDGWDSWPIAAFLEIQFLPTYLLSFQDAFNIRQEETLQGPPHQRGVWGKGDHSQWGGGWQPSSSELCEGPIWLVIVPWRLWWVAPPYYGMETVADSFGIIFPIYLNTSI